MSELRRSNADPNSLALEGGSGARGILVVQTRWPSGVVRSLGKTVASLYRVIQILNICIVVNGVHDEAGGRPSRR
jgi:hypothetical protein